MTIGDAPELAQSEAELKAQWEAFSAKAPLPPVLHCDTQLRCMELGFEGHPNYPQCQPVNGDKHANLQYDFSFSNCCGPSRSSLGDLAPKS